MSDGVLVTITVTVVTRSPYLIPSIQQEEYVTGSTPAGTHSDRRGYPAGSDKSLHHWPSTHVVT